MRSRHGDRNTGRGASNGHPYTRLVPRAWCSPQTKLPRNYSGPFGVAAGGSIVREQCQADWLDGSLRNRLRPPEAIEVRSRVTWRGGIYLDGGVAEQASKLHGEHIERGLGRTVTNQVCGGQIGAGAPSQRAEAARYV